MKEMNMKKLIILILTFQNLIYSQTSKFIDSLLKNNCNEIIVLKKECIGCIPSEKYPCKDYRKNADFDDLYIFWKIKSNNYLKTINGCGNSKIFKIIKWNKNPFEIVNSRNRILDTIKLKYPLSLNRKDSTWFESKFSHNQICSISFPNYKIKEITINYKAFNRIIKIDKIDEILMKNDVEYKKNIHRYIFNNNSIIKELLDILDKKIIELNRK